MLVPAALQGSKQYAVIFAIIQLFPYNKSLLQLLYMQAVHPDKTLRKSKRTAPRMRPSVPLPPAPPKTAQTNKLAGWLSGGEVRREEQKVEEGVTKKV
jgi:hypothetical protein